MHEYFWGPYNNEHYHEFCYRNIASDKQSVGLFGSPAIEREYWMNLGSVGIKKDAFRS